MSESAASGTSTGTPTGAAPSAPKSLGRDFGLLWAGQSASYLGDRITLFVVPTLMVFVLGSTAFEIGLISTAQYLAIPLLSLGAGVIVDRMDLRRLLIGCDLLRFFVILAIPVAYFMDVLSVPLLFVCVVLVSAGTVFFNIGYLPMLTTLVHKDQLVSANTRMETSRTVAEVSGPAAAAGLYAGLGPHALFVDAGTYLFSAATIAKMKHTTQRNENPGPVLDRLKHGIRENWSDEVLRRCTLGTLGANIGGPIFVTQMPVLAYQGLGLSVGVFGLVMSLAAVGAVLGALVAPRVSRWLGQARMQAWAIFFHSGVGLGILFAPTLPSAAVLAVTLGFYGFFFSWYNICSQSVRQAWMRLEDQAVIFAAYRTITWGVIPISTFVGGAAVSLLSQQYDILDAAKIAMVGATVIGMCAYIPLAPVQALIDKGRPRPADVDAAEEPVAAEKPTR